MNHTVAEGKKQVKVIVDARVAGAFKQACETAGISMAEVLAQHMTAFSKTPVTSKETNYTTRKQRRRAINAIAKQLERIKAYEEDYQDRIPENLQGSSVYERATELISKLDEVLEILAEI